MNDSHRTARRIVVHGRVQGVFFRDSFREQAQRRGVTGWVRNRADGAVEAHLEGRAVDVAAVVAWAHEGPPRAVVERVDESDTAPVGAHGFDVVG